MDYLLHDNPGGLVSTLELAHLEQHFEIIVFQPYHIQGSFFTNNQQKSSKTFLSHVTKTLFNFFADSWWKKAPENSPAEIQECQNIVPDEPVEVLNLNFQVRQVRSSP